MQVTLQNIRYNQQNTPAKRGQIPTFPNAHQQIPTFPNEHQQIPTFPNRTQAIPTFEGGAAGIITETLPKKSSIFKNINKLYDKGVDKIAKYFTAPLVDSRPMNWAAEKFKNSRYLFNHLLAVGSAITSGMYMYKTLDNDKLDKDRKRTLALNQFLTFVISTAGAYAIDSKLGNWWDKQTAKFAGLRLNDETLEQDFVAKNKEILKNNEEIIKANKDKVSKKDLKLLLDDTEMVKEFVKTRNNFKSMLPKQKKALLNQIEGMGLLKTMIVFGAVYRYLVPVLVTPIANKLGEKYLKHKQETQPQKS